MTFPPHSSGIHIGAYETNTDFKDNVTHCYRCGGEIRAAREYLSHGWSYAQVNCGAYRRQYNHPGMPDFLCHTCLKKALDNLFFGDEL